MKTIVISIRSLWACKILNGDKKIEVRKGLALYNALKKAEERGEEVEFLMYVTKAKPCLFSVWGYSQEGTKKTEYFISENYRKPSDFDLNGKVVARFKAKAEVIDYFEDFFRGVDMYDTLMLPYSELLAKSCLNEEQIGTYLQRKPGTALHILNLETFDKPKDLADYGLKRAPQSWGYTKKGGTNGES